MSPKTNLQSSDYAGMTFGDYRLLYKIGQGGMGDVYKAKQISLGRTVAIKLLSNARLTSPQARKRFLREGATIAKLSHPYIVPIFDAGEKDGILYYSMELITGLPINVYCRQKKVDANEMLQLMIKICQGVQFAHQHGIIHRDIKPENILVDKHNMPRILDFGLAKLTSENSDQFSQLTQDGKIIGTPAFMAPEQTRGRSELIDERTDVYGLGLILYHLTTGKYPYDITGSTTDIVLRIRNAEPVRPKFHVPAVPKNLEAIILEAIQKEKNLRYQSAHALEKDIVRFLNNQPVKAHQQSIFYRSHKFWRRYQTTILLAICYTIILISTLTFAIICKQNEQQNQKQYYKNLNDKNKEIKLLSKIAEEEKQKTTQMREIAEHEKIKTQFRTQMLTLRLASESVAKHDSEGFDLINTLPNTWETGLLKRELQRICYHAPQIIHNAGNTITCHPTKQLIAIANKKQINIYKTTNLNNPIKQLKNSKNCKEIQFSPNGKQLAAIHKTTIKIWNSTTGKQLFTLNAHQTIACFAYCPEQNIIATGIQNKQLSELKIIIWNTNNGEQIQQITYSEQAHAITAISFSPNGTLMCTGDTDSTITFWDVETFDKLHSVYYYGPPIKSLCFSPNSKTLAAQADEYNIKIWDCANFEETQQLNGNHYDIKDIKFTPNGETLISATGDGTIKFWNLKNNQEQMTLHTKHPITKISFNLDGTKLFCSDSSKTITCWQTNTLKDRIQLLGNILGTENCMTQFINHGEQIIYLNGGYSPALRKWQITNPESTIYSNEPELPNEQIIATISPDGELLATETENGEITLFSLETGQDILHISGYYSTTNQRQITAIRFMPDSKTLTTADIDKKLRFWQDGNELTTQQQEMPWQVACMDYSPNSKYLVCGSAETGEIKWFSCENGEELYSHKIHERPISNLKFSPGGTILAISSKDSLLTLISSESRQTLQTIKCTSGYFTKIAFSPDTRLLATVSSSRKLQLWHISSGDELLIQDAIKLKDAVDVNFSPDGRYLAVATSNGYIELLESTNPAKP